MKYLFTAERNEVESPGAEEWLGMLKASRDWMDARLKDGTLDCGLGYLEGNGGLAIVNADSNEGAQDVLLSYPMYAFYDWEITPLCDLIGMTDKFIAYFEQMG